MMWYWSSQLLCEEQTLVRKELLQNLGPQQLDTWGVIPKQKTENGKGLRENIIYFISILVVVLRLKPSASCILGKHSTTELYTPSFEEINQNILDMGSVKYLSDMQVVQGIPVFLHVNWE